MSNLESKVIQIFGIEYLTLAFFITILTFSFSTNNRLYIAISSVIVSFIGICLFVTLILWVYSEDD